MKKEKLQDKLRRVFASEFRSHLHGIETDLVRLESANGEATDPEVLNNLFRAMHSIKGAAATVGAKDIESCAHEAEGRLSKIRDGKLSLGAPQLQSLFETVDQLRDLESEYQGGGEAATKNQKVPDNPGLGTKDPVASSPEDSASAVSRAEADYIEVSAARLARMLDMAADLQRISRTLSSDGERLAQAMELSSSVNIIGAVKKDGAQQQLRTLCQDLKRLNHIVTPLETEILNARMLRMVDALDWLPRMLRDLGHAAGKKVKLEITGGEVEVDRSVALVLLDPLRHLMRNAVDHGLEPVPERRAAGKVDEGHISLQTRSHNGWLEIDVSDDGRGLDTNSIAARAKKCGMSVPKARQQILDLVFEPGFSTSTEVSSVSGRGMGLSAVREDLVRVGGNIKIIRSNEQGSVFRMSLPANVVRIRALQFVCSGVNCAVDCAAVDYIERIPRGGFQSSAGSWFIKTKGQSVPVIALDKLLQLDPGSYSKKAWYHVIVLKDFDSRAGFIVDSVDSVSEVLVREFSARIGKQDTLLGSSLTSEGETTYVLNAPGLLQRGIQSRNQGAIMNTNEETQAKKLLIVDDTFTTRALVETILENAGYEIVSANNGEEAWRILETRQIDLLVSDVEMPLLDGIGLTRRVRQSAKLKELPIILLTGMDSADDRMRGLEAGADAYLVKSAFDQSELLNVVEELF